MPDAPSPTSDNAASPRTRDWAILAPILGLVLLGPPIVGLFATQGTVFGAPVIILYIFGVWLGLIVMAAMLARDLRRGEAAPHDTL